VDNRLDRRQTPLVGRIALPETTTRFHFFRVCARSLVSIWNQLDLPVLLTRRPLLWSVTRVNNCFSEAILYMAGLAKTHYTLAYEHTPPPTDWMFKRLDDTDCENGYGKVKKIPKYLKFERTTGIPCVFHRNSLNWCR
jgi:hypothetical protein